MGFPHGFGDTPMGRALDERSELERENGRLVVAIAFERYHKKQKREAVPDEATYIAEHPAMRRLTEAVLDVDRRIARLRELHPLP